MAQDPETERGLKREELDAFLDEHVDRALLPLEALFSTDELAQVRSILSEQMRVDPVVRLLADAALREREG